MIRVFVDSSVLVAAIRSPTGGSAEVLRYAARGLLEAVISPDVVEEVTRYFSKEMPLLVPGMRLVFGTVPFAFAQPTVEDLIAAAIYTPTKDQAIVAAAVAGHVAYLVTLDKKHLLDKRDQIEANVRFGIVRPEEILTLVRNPR